MCPTPRPHATVTACRHPLHPLPTRHPVAAHHDPTVTPLPRVLHASHMQPPNTSHAGGSGPRGWGSWHAVTGFCAGSRCNCPSHFAAACCSWWPRIHVPRPALACPALPMPTASRHSLRGGAWLEVAWVEHAVQPQGATQGAGGGAHPDLQPAVAAHSTLWLCATPPHPRVPHSTPPTQPQAMAPPQDFPHATSHNREHTFTLTTSTSMSVCP